MYSEKFESIAKENSTIGLSILSCNKKEILTEYSYGYASIEEVKESSMDTIYRIASISKVVVASCVMMLYDEGLVDLDEDISNYLGYKVRNPHFPSDAITIKMLMTQTSSIFDCEDEGYGYDRVNGPLFFVDLERLLTDKTYEYYTDKTFLNEKPGTKFCYSNFGCGILACIVEKVTGMYFTDFVNTRLFNKLGVDASFRVDEIKDKSRIASLYRVVNNEVYLTRDTNKFLEILFPKYPLGNNFRGPAGGLFISPRGLAKFMQMLMNYGTYDGIRYLKEDTVKLMKEVHFKLDKRDGIYKQKGLQMVVLDYKGTRLYGHTGDAYGLKSFMLFNDEYGYIFLCNGAKYMAARDHFVTIQSRMLQAMMEQNK